MLSSRIIALNPDGSERWNVFVDGVVTGTPAVGADKDVIYVSHNVLNTIDNGERRGKVTVLRDNGGNPTIEAEVFAENRFGPFGPLTVKSTTANGVSNDTVFVAESWGGGYTSDNGYVLFLAPSGGDYALQVFSEWGFSSAVAPTVSRDSDMLWMAGAGTTVGGWVSDSFTSAQSGGPSQPDWQSVFVQKNLENITMGKLYDCDIFFYTSRGVKISYKLGLFHSYQQRFLRWYQPTIRCCLLLR